MFARFVDRTTQATAQSVLNMGDLSRFPIRMPAPQQIDVVLDLLNRRDPSYVIEEMTAQIELLRERKRSLITAAVTGEFDVTTASGRGVA